MKIVDEVNEKLDIISEGNIMTYPINWTDDNHIKRGFSWQARTGVGPKFGSRPIGWYQTHHANAHDEIVKRAKAQGIDGDFSVKKKGNTIHVNGKPIGTVQDIYRAADNKGYR
jgi:hypothetical protein